MGLSLRREPFDGPVAAGLIALVQDEYRVRYGGPDDTPVVSAEFAPPGGEFLVARLGEGVVGCGGYRAHLLPGALVPDAEIKRMFVAADMRGRGYSRVILAVLEASARDRGYGRIILETGNQQPEAVGLYSTAGYRRIEGFGLYAGEAGSLYFAKPL